MPRRQLETNTYYHIYNRGCNKQRIFFCEKDFERFGNTIQRYLQEFPTIQIHVWVFIPNHFHLLLSEKGTPNSGLKKEDQEFKPGFKSSNISDFMNRIQQAYARYFTMKYSAERKKAPVFEGRFKAKEITDEDYLSRVAYYVRHNAVKHEIVDNSNEWDWAGATDSPSFPAMEFVQVDPEFDPGFE